MEKIYQQILDEFIANTNNLWPTVSVADVTAAAARMGIARDDLHPLLCYLLEKGCKVDTPANQEEAQMLRVAGLHSYDMMLEKAIRSYFSKPDPNNEFDIRTIESITKHRARLRLYLHDPVKFQVLQMKEEGISAEEITRKLEMPLEELYLAELKIYNSIRMAFPKYHVIHRRTM